MSNFVKYQHIERFGTSEVDGIEYGECFVFPKIDGTNGSVWLEEHGICAGSRKRHLFDGERDNAGFRDWAKASQGIKKFFARYPHLRLFGEWLVPHSLKTYRDDAWKRFYIFDVMEGEEYVPYDVYQPWLDGLQLDYITPFAKIKNPDVEALQKIMEENDYLIETGKGVGEGVVIKNYEWKNRHGRVVWAKMVRSEFKERHREEMGAPEKKAKASIEEEIVEKYVSSAMVEKVYAKIDSEEGWRSKDIPRLLNTVYYDLVREECWNFVKEHRNPRVDFKRLMGFSFQKVKSIKPELF